MSGAAEYRQKAEQYEAEALKTNNPDIKRHYQALALEFRERAGYHEKKGSLRLS